MQSRKAANEMTMIATLRSVAGSQVTYQGIHQLYVSLTQLEGQGLIDQSIVDGIGAASVGKSGFYFTEEAPTATSFSIMIAPLGNQYGDHCYGIFEDGVIYVKPLPTDYVTRASKGPALGQPASAN